uniref:Uncharacterized protein n=1 Tax=Glossina brevipalpis TaxID=37001 RepID=A0A1A9WB96_9MUSC
MDGWMVKDNFLGICTACRAAMSKEAELIDCLAQAKRQLSHSCLPRFNYGHTTFSSQNLRDTQQCSVDDAVVVFVVVVVVVVVVVIIIVVLVVVIVVIVAVVVVTVVIVIVTVTVTVGFVSNSNDFVKI